MLKKSAPSGLSRSTVRTRTTRLRRTEPGAATPPEDTDYTTSVDSDDEEVETAQRTTLKRKHSSKGPSSPAADATSPALKKPVSHEKKRDAQRKPATQASKRKPEDSGKEPAVKKAATVSASPLSSVTLERARPAGRQQRQEESGDEQQQQHGQQQGATSAFGQQGAMMDMGQRDHEQGTMSDMGQKQGAMGSHTGDELVARDDDTSARGADDSL